MAKVGAVMENTWHRANVTLFDGRSSGRKTFSVFADYELGDWTFGLYFAPDPCWVEVVLRAGPLSLSVIYWRSPPRFKAGDQIDAIEET